MANTTTLNETTRSPIDGTEYCRLATPGANWKAQLSSIIGTLGRTKLTADTTYYVATALNGGNDSNPGTMAQPWLTLQHAMDFVAGNIDFAGHTITVSIGAGSFVGFQTKATVGGGGLFFQGAGSASTTITTQTPNAVCCVLYLGLLSCTLFFDKMTLNVDVVGGLAAILLGNGPAPFVQLGDINFGSADLKFTNTGGAPANIISINAQFTLFTTFGNFSIANNWASFLTSTFFGAFSDSGTWTVSGTPAITTFISCTNQSHYDTDGGSASFTGAATGKRFVVDGNSTILQTGSATFFPGNTAGTMSNGGIYT